MINILGEIMIMSFSEFVEKKICVLELYSLIESCLSKGVSVDQFTKYTFKPVIERLNFTSEEEFVDQIKTKVSLFTELMMPAQPAAAQPAAAQAKPFDLNQKYANFIGDEINLWKKAIIKQLDKLIVNVEKTVDIKHKDKTQNFIAKSIGKNLLEKLKKAISDHQPRFNFTIKQKPQSQSPQPH